MSFRTLKIMPTIDALIDFIERSTYLTVLTGAGCSTESGIPDYRDDEGNWKHRQPVQYQQFIQHPTTRKRYWARSMVGWERVARATPNGAHRSLARLEELGVVHHLITQNVDGLHQEAGSRNVIDLHGRLDTVVCLDCRSRFHRSQFQEELHQLNIAWLDISAAFAPDGDAELEDVDYGTFHVPACRNCSGMLKPDVVFFGESVPRERVDLAMKKLHESDGLLVVGSSLMVWSGYRFARAAAESNIPIAAVNTGKTRADDLLQTKVTDRCELALPQVVRDWAESRHRSPFAL
jgi:NAD-dependent SIR2 family protein deacetylase